MKVQGQVSTANAATALARPRSARCLKSGRIAVKVHIDTVEIFDTLNWLAYDRLTLYAYEPSRFRRAFSQTKCYWAVLSAGDSWSSHLSACASPDGRWLLHESPAS